MCYGIVAISNRDTIFAFLNGGKAHSEHSKKHSTQFENKINYEINKILKPCLIKNNNVGQFVNKYRGERYYLPDPVPPECVLTAWNLSHFIMYSILGFFSPSYFFLAMLFGVTWEMLEYHVGCADASDLLMNLFGFMFGRQLYLYSRR